MSRILVLNSDDEIMNMIKQLLESKGYDAKYTGDRNAVTGIISEFKPDLLLLDFCEQNIIGDLEGKRGMEDIPVLLMTGYGDQYPQHTEKIAGTIKKPFSIGELTAQLEAILKINISDGLHSA